jgi:hypothetical protein
VQEHTVLHTPAFVLRAHPLTPPYLIQRIQTYAKSLPIAWHETPFVGELFESSDHCYSRLQAYAFLQGFVVVKFKGGAKKGDPRARYKCIHHGEETKNWRQLEDLVEKDKDGNIKCDKDFLVDVEREAVNQWLKPEDVAYIDTYWKLKEKRVVRAFTKLLPNLGATSTQRVEVIHPIFKQVLHGQLSLEVAAQRISQQL